MAGAYLPLPSWLRDKSLIQHARAKPGLIERRGPPVREEFMNVTRRTLLGTIATGFSAGMGFPAHAQSDWPSRVVRLISPYGAGGANDISLRILAEQLGRRLGEQFIVEN